MRLEQLHRHQARKTSILEAARKNELSLSSAATGSPGSEKHGSSHMIYRRAAQRSYWDLLLLGKLTAAPVAQLLSSKVDRSENQHVSAFAASAGLNLFFPVLNDRRHWPLTDFLPPDFQGTFPFCRDFEKKKERRKKKITRSGSRGDGVAERCETMD